MFTTLVRTFASSATKMTTETAYFANGCFWGTEYHFRKHFVASGINDLEVGFIGGKMENPSYEDVCREDTGHAEAIKIIFDSEQLEYADLVEFFYRMHDASQLNKQGPDTGTQYRSEIFYTTPQQKVTAERVTRKIQEERYKPIKKKIVTSITDATNLKWYKADPRHQDYLQKKPTGYHCPSHKLYW